MNLIDFILRKCFPNGAFSVMTKFSLHFIGNLCTVTRCSSNMTTRFISFMVDRRVGGDPLFITEIIPGDTRNAYFQQVHIIYSSNTHCNQSGFKHLCINQADNGFISSVHVHGRSLHNLLVVHWSLRCGTNFYCRHPMGIAWF